MACFNSKDEEDLSTPMISKKSVKIIYNMYSDAFTTDNAGILTATTIDDEYCLSDVMPGCIIHLTAVSSAEYTERIQVDPSFEYPFEKEDPRGTFCALQDRATYYVVVVQNADQEEHDKEKLVDQWVKLKERSDDAEARANAINTAVSGVGLSDFDKSYSEYANLPDVWGEAEALEGEQESAPPQGITDGDGGAEGGWK